MISPRDELGPLIIAWIDDHPRYGKLRKTLLEYELTHEIIGFATDYSVISLYRPIDIPSDMIGDGSGRGVNCADPEFFNKINLIIEQHIGKCLICSSLIDNI